MSKKLIIGLGPGRSGTMSLAKFLDKQRHSYFVHEGAYNMPSLLKYTTGAYLPCETDLTEYKIWYSNLLIKSDNSNYFGDVSASILLYVPIILNDHPDAVFICIKRNKEDIVKSFLTVTKGVNHWSTRNAIFSSLNIWYKMFPKIEKSTKEGSIRTYVDAYYKQAERFEQNYPNSFRIFPINELNTMEGKSRILSFAGIERIDRVTSGSFHSNKSTYTFIHLTFQIILMGYALIRRFFMSFDISTGR